MVLWQYMFMEGFIPALRFLITIIVLKQVAALDVLPQKELYTPDYSVYHNLSHINIQVQQVVENNPEYVRYFKDFTSRNGQTQNVIQVSNFMTYGSENNDRVKILFSYGEHAREFLPVESILHLLHQLLLVEKTWKSPDHLKTSGVHHILNFIDLYLIVTANPDGRRYVEQSHNYCWRGTSTGVDINRNFDWEFGGKGSSGNKKDEEYRGPLAFSEPETRVYRELTERVQFDAFISFHSGIRQIYIPYADTKSKKIRREPDNGMEMLKLAHLLATVTGKTYRYGKAANLNDYTADGTVFDYMAGIRKIPFSYAIELWGPDDYKGTSCFDLFNPSNENLEDSLIEVNRIYPAFFKYLTDWKRRKSKHLHDNQTQTGLDKIDLYISHADKDQGHSSQGEMPPATPSLLLLLVLVLICLIFFVHGKFPVFRRIYHRRRIVSLKSLGSSLATNMFST